jgi:hypothetical protein
MENQLENESSGREKREGKSGLGFRIEKQRGGSE